MRTRTGDKGRDILDAAMGCFMRRGIAATTMKQIAAAAGLAVGTLYLYYRDKDEVIAACADSFATRHLEDARALTGRAARSPARALTAYLIGRYDAWRIVSDGSPQAAELAAAVMRLRPERVADFERLFLHTLEHLIREGVEQGRFRPQDPRASARALAYAVAIFFPFPGREHPRQPGRAAFVETVRWFVDVALAAVPGVR
jgi:AcrR family transcriptional regulator